MAQIVSNLVQKEMTRKEFLATMGFGLASVMGFSTIIRLLTGKSVEYHLTGHASGGYGSSSYGGNTES